MSEIKVAINGFGRIGRLVLRHLLDMHKNEGVKVDIVGINDLAPLESLAHLFEFDSVHGRFDGDVNVTETTLTLNDDEFSTYAERNPADLPWKELDVDVVIECTGLFRNREGMMKHLEAGAKKVVLSAPGKGVDATIVRGVNNSTYDIDKHHLISNASCTTNALATTVKVLDDEFGFKQGNMTTIHSYTNDQPMLDSVHKDYRRMRAGAVNMIPTSTGASQAVGLVLPHLSGKIEGLAVRVPTPNVSLVDLTARLEKQTDEEEICEAYRQASESKELKGIIDYEWRSLVSSDFNGNTHSAVVDFPTLQIIEGNLVKILSWYDNEQGYARRLAELTHEVMEHL